MKLSRLGSLWLPLTLRESGGTGDSVQAPSSFKRRQLDEATEPSLAPDDQIAALQERCLQLESQNAQLQSEIVERDAKIARLEACIAASSQTSSQPRESVNPSLNSTGGRKLKANVTESERSLMDWLESTEFKSRDR
jgi:predicted  nucleic acid-binding Zn-ribbon protein